LLYCESGFDDAEEAQDVETMATWAVELYFAYSRAGEWRKSLRLTKVIGIIERASRESDMFGMPYYPYPMLLSMCGAIMATIGNFRDGEAYCQKGLRFAQMVNDALSMATADNAYGCLLCLKGDGRNALPYLQKAIRYFEETQIAVALPMAWYYLGIAHKLLGECRMALSDVEKGLEIQRKSGLAYYTSTAYLVSIEAYLELGEFDKARSSLDEGLKIARADNERLTEASMLIHLGTVHHKLATGDYVQSEELIRQGIRIHDEVGAKPSLFRGYYYLGILYSDIGRRQEAVEALSQARDAFREMGMDYWLARTEKALEGLKAQ
jgi:tetratricopeptide (TPR) repeat protein